METQWPEAPGVALVERVVPLAANFVGRISITVWIIGPTPRHESPERIALVVNRSRLARAPTLVRVTESLLSGSVRFGGEIRIDTARSVKYEIEFSIGVEVHDFPA